MRKLWLDKSNPYVRNYCSIVGKDFIEMQRHFALFWMYLKSFISKSWRVCWGSLGVLWLIFSHTTWYAFWGAWTKEAKQT